MASLDRSETEPYFLYSALLLGFHFGLSPCVASRGPPLSFPTVSFWTESLCVQPWPSSLLSYSVIFFIKADGDVPLWTTLGKGAAHRERRDFQLDVSVISLSSVVECWSSSPPWDVVLGSRKESGTSWNGVKITDIFVMNVSVALEPRTEQMSQN